MNPTRVNRTCLDRLTDLPNVGPSLAADLRLIGVEAPGQLAGKCPFEMYDALCERTGVRHDPCVLDVFMSVTSFMAGGDAKPWWEFTAQRKSALAGGQARQASAE